MTIGIAIIGYGKIARDQHVPAIAANDSFRLEAICTRGPVSDAPVPVFDNAAAMFGALGASVQAVVVATPPGPRFALAEAALAAGRAVLLEKPPAATLGEVDALVRQAHERGLALYAGWHSQHAAAVQPAARLLAGRTVGRLRIRWHEDVRVWHPGQDWVWDAGGLGVFDPGINALSIASAILPAPLIVGGACLSVPANRQSPIGAEITFSGIDGAASFNWNHTGAEEWTIDIDTADGLSLSLREGGARLFVGGAEQRLDGAGEYPSLYRRFAGLVNARAVEVDAEPMRIVADAMLVARRGAAPAFHWNGTDA
ncbi:Gfo/Idh/MocA family oxidoreductase [Erythrobacteraceae bacterium CFH 75059]|uniref:Gfo/Idh/MocA family protein n=1 Tax=Qipengyuania thermophila TaxID=2509361 RepID=UPI001021E24B|nr:Gfo/Idh/MocA family oxidoreductase [Qipengyuania thermophila]TCD02062.1 Gfo/Idh/MocA family oxidoreductase [Erythrobacteraceae bacterium CFH 75059]